MAIKLKEQSRLTLVFMVNNQKLNPLNNQACYKVYQYDNKLDEINWYVFKSSMASFF